MRQRSLAISTNWRNAMPCGRVESQYLVGSFSPSGHLIERQARLGKPRASSLTESGRCLALRRMRVGTRPWPDHFLGGSGPVPGAHTVVFDKMPATYSNASALTLARNSLLLP